MLTIILATLFGIVFTWIASQNPNNIPVNILGVIIEVPLYLIGAMSFLSGIFISLLFSIFDYSAEAVNLRKREAGMKSIANENDDLRRKMVKLEADNTNLRNELNRTKTEYREQISQQRKDNIKDFFNRIFHPNNTSSASDIA